MVARIDIPIMFNYSIAATGRSIRTYARLHSAISRKRCIEKIYKTLSDIVPDPTVKHVAHEPSEAFC